MKNKTVMHLCIADVNELLTKAMREHVLKNGEYDVSEVVWSDRDNMFHITLEPLRAETEASK